MCSRDFDFLSKFSSVGAESTIKMEEKWDKKIEDWFFYLKKINSICCPANKESKKWVLFENQKKKNLKTIDISLLKLFL